MEPILAFLLGASIMIVIGLTVKFVNNYTTLRDRTSELENKVETLKHQIDSDRHDFIHYVESTSRRFDGVETQIENSKKVQKVIKDLSKSNKKLLKG